MKKLLGGASAVALILGLSAPGFAAELSVGGGSATNADAIAANVFDQNVTNDVELDGNLIDDDGIYDGSMIFGVETFEDQDLVTNNFNSGINALQQAGVAVAVADDNECGCGAVAVNYLEQASANSITLTGEDSEALNENAQYNGRMEFGDDTFKDQDVVVNNFNTGWNAAQQGGIAIAVATGTLQTSQGN